MQKTQKIILHAVNAKKKLLGICYGAEILALALGGTIRKSSVIRGETKKLLLMKIHFVQEKNLSLRVIRMKSQNLETHLNV